MKIRILQVLLGIIFLADLVLIDQNQQDFRVFTKTLLMPILTLIYIFEARNRAVRIDAIFITALVFSFFGDLILLFSWGFLLGLGSFLLAHLCYIFSFKKQNQRKISEFWPILLSIYASVLLVFLLPYLKEMKIPLIFYGIVITTMMHNAIKTGNRLLILGAVLFLFSDSLLSINLFVEETIILSLSVMITYFAAQLFLVKGMVSSLEKL